MTLHNRTVGTDVRELGALVGEVLETQTSTDAFETVERLRTTAIDYRNGEIDSRNGLDRTLRGLDPETAVTVARAFTTYFEMVNLAEERERVRAIRTASQEGSLADSLSAAVESLDDRDPAVVEQILEDVLIEPTFTAHPTEAHRKTVKAKLRTIADHLVALDERRLTDTEHEQLKDALEAQVTSLWGTRQIRERQPEPLDEARNVHWYLENTLFDTTGEVYREIEDTLGAEFDDIGVPKLFEFRSWAGSDRDGNPYVTPDVTSETLARQRRSVLEKYQEALADLSNVLAHDADRLDTGATFDDRLAANRKRFPTLADQARERYLDEPYRQHLRLMGERLERIGDVRPNGYDEVAEFTADLDALATSLRANGGERIAAVHVDPLERQAQTFGFCLAGLDLRDHQEKHTEAIAAALDREDIAYESLDEDERVELLTEAILQDAPLIDVTDREGLFDPAARVLERFDRLNDWQREYGADAIDTYCISMAEKPSHVLEVLFLADQAGAVSLPEYCGIDVVPLLETEAALDGAREIMGTLFENEAYSQALAARGDVQEVMLGYSDSNKENGFFAANWDLYRNQRRLADIVDDHDVDLRLFHGRGGSISRGGGPMNEALLALPNETVNGQVKFTEQGEAIAEKYANPRIAERNLEQMLNAQIRARARSLDQPEDDVREEWLDAAATIADAARTAYQDLLETEGFVSYFEQATPITVIEELNMGSRPASRSGERTVEDLRTIPWVFSWTQSRCILPGWYGLGAGIEAYLEAGGSTGTLQSMYDEWAFFRTTIDNAALALARTDMEIASEYATVADDDLEARFFPVFEAEYERAADFATTIGDRDDLVNRGWLRESLRRRNPYVDPLNVLQTHLLDREHRTETEKRALRLTVKGIAAGMKNTG
ncbi:phosphoenolpyruvate carboxylase [Halococcus salifodinae]|uniref:phosphoenolpyruvate carboxylase n=1 Tax=Halococcus salifodinae DSM 8989 TaxID=1227456 RepID=M0MT13_9EURY|nr:phosphoenolpyruvate carboxylase [Halococcus salifodinae]EMA48478.1 phosphoenolpyruvate carboxylase [Halococcus salifodinae DSM 8989]